MNQRPSPSFRVSRRRVLAGLAVPCVGASLLGPFLAGCLPVPSRGPEPQGETDEPFESSVDAPANTEETAAKSPAEGADSLQKALDFALDEGFRRRLSVAEHGAWQVLHGVLAYGLPWEFETPEGRLPAMSYLQAGGGLAGFVPSPGDLLGEPRRRGYRFELEAGSMTGQGHRDQWLAILSQTTLDTTAVFRAGKNEFMLDDLVQQALWDVPRNVEQEFSWTLIGVTAHRPTDFSWTARDGDQWTVERLLEAELQQSLESAACGGTHRLIGLSLAIDQHRRKGGLIRGVWVKVEDVLAQATAMAEEYQNGDGSFSTTFLFRHGWSPDLGDVLRTTGHVFEFLSMSLETGALSQRWVEAAAGRLCSILKASEGIPLECGALYHALHGMLIYRQRRFPDSPWQPPLLESIDERA